MFHPFNTTIARLWTITPTNREPFHFTDHDRSIWFGGVLYRVAQSFEASAVQSSINGGQTNITILAGLSDDFITRDDLERGIYDGAAVELRVCDYTAPDARNYAALIGTVGRVTMNNDMAALIEVAGANPALYRALNERYTAFCRAEFGDSRCTVDLAPYSADFAVTDAINAVRFATDDLQATPTNRFKLGHILWATGLNRGCISEVIANAAGAVTILIKPPYQIGAGDTGTIYQGCPKTLVACGGYGNTPNFRGEPYVPTERGIKAQGAL